MAQSCIYVKCFDSIREHPKMYALAETLKIPDYAAIGIIMGVSLWGARNTRGGDITDIPTRALADAIHWKKKPELLFNALVDCGFIDKTEDGRIVLHEFEEYGGKLEEARQKSSERVKAFRERKRTDCNDDVIVTEALQKRACNRYPKEEEKEEEEENLYPPIAPLGGEMQDGKQGENLAVLKTAAANAQHSMTLVDHRFAEFWKEYPKKQGKGAAEKSFRRIRPTEEVHKQIMDAIAKAKGSEQWTQENGRYIPNPSTWLNQRRWEDEYPAANKPGERKGAAARAFSQRSTQPGDLFEVF